MAASRVRRVDAEYFAQSDHRHFMPCDTFPVMVRPPKQEFSLLRRSTCCARAMLVLFCTSVLLKEHNRIPVDEVIFYVFTLVRYLSWCGA